MFEDKSGRLATTIEEAEIYLWKFIAENLAITDQRVKTQSHDFDLFLPWLLQIFDRHGEQPGEKLSMTDLNSLYMDAAWSLVSQGYLRPGPRMIDGEQPKDGYGNGYSLTAIGKHRISLVEVPPEGDSI
ncbi:MAG TPA: hypothetical protein VMI31_13055 [Fimbriimonadaceae bacterium]|nr:hypothetical protein [Fimbriimonadaceae bacterium]